MRNAECGMRSAECGVRSASAECGMPNYRRFRDTTLDRQHHDPCDRKGEDRGGEKECEQADPALVEFSRSAGEEKDGGEQDCVRQVLAGQTAGVTRVFDSLGGFRGSIGCFASPS